MSKLTQEDCDTCSEIVRRVMDIPISQNQIKRLIELFALELEDSVMTETLVLAVRSNKDAVTTTIQNKKIIA